MISMVLTSFLVFFNFNSIFAAEGMQSNGANNLYSRGSPVRSQTKPKIITGDQIFRAELGQSLILPCRVANLGDYVVMWKQGNRVMTAEKYLVRKDDRIKLRDDYSLEINRLRGDDQGVYTCEVDMWGKPMTVEHTVEVLVPPAVQAMPSEGHVTARKGNDVTLRCSGQGNPNPRITWMKQSGLLPNGKEKQEGLSLELKNVKRQDAGTYICRATNGVGQAAKDQVEVEIKYPPEIEIEQNWYHRDQDIEVELICIVHAQPQAEISWYRRQKKLHETDRQLFQRKENRQTLHIRKVNSKDFGNYSCRAENGLGKARTYTALSGQPRPPRFTSESIGYRAHTYNVTWTTDSYAPITGYRLLYRRSDGLPVEQKHHIDEQSGGWQAVSIPTTKSNSSFSNYASYTLTGLQPGAVYDVIAKAKNRHGFSDFSKIFNFFNKGVDYSTQQLSAGNGGPELAVGAGSDVIGGVVGSSDLERSPVIGHHDLGLGSSATAKFIRPSTLILQFAAISLNIKMWTK